MGSTGKDKSSGNDYETFESVDSIDWFSKHSNLDNWKDKRITEDERLAVREYTGIDYDDLNTAQYTIPWEDMDDWNKRDISNLYNALDKFDLKSGIVVNRACDFKVFGRGEDEEMTMAQIRDYLKPTNGVVQNDGFMSFSTKPGGHPVDGSGLLIKLSVPPTKGAGAYIEPLSYHKNEKEFLLNNNAVLKFDYDHMYKKNGVIVIPATYLGRSEAQTISPTYKGLKVKSKGGKK